MTSARRQRPKGARAGLNPTAASTGDGGWIVGIPYAAGGHIAMRFYMVALADRGAALKRLRRQLAIDPAAELSAAPLDARHLQSRALAPGEVRMLGKDRSCKTLAPRSGTPEVDDPSGLSSPALGRGWRSAFEG